MSHFKEGEQFTVGSGMNVNAVSVKWVSSYNEAMASAKYDPTIGGQTQLPADDYIVVDHGRDEQILIAVALDREDSKTERMPSSKHRYIVNESDVKEQIEAQ